LKTETIVYFFGCADAAAHVTLTALNLLPFENVMDLFNGLSVDAGLVPIELMDKLLATWGSDCDVVGLL
jgi:hypothetical protein